MNSRPDRHILAVIDLGLGSQHVVSTAADVARVKRAKLTLLHVVDYTPPVGSDFPLVSQAQECAAQIEAARIRLQRMAQTAGAKADVQVVAGSPHGEVERMAEALGTDLIVMGGWRARLAALFGVGADCLIAPVRRWEILKV